MIAKLNNAFPLTTFGPDYSFPKTRGNYKGKIHPLMIDTNVLYPIDRPIRYIGWIKSRGQKFRIWKRGFCVLENGYLMWYRDEAMTILKREFFLKDVVIDFSTDDPAVPNTCARLTVSHSETHQTRRYLLKFQEKISRFTWLSYLRAHEEWAHR